MKDQLIIHPVDFEDNKFDVGSCAYDIYKKMKELNQGNKKVGIIFAVSNDQALKIYQNYCLEKYSTNQGYKTYLDKVIESPSNNYDRMLTTLTEWIAKANNYDEMHILPIATTMSNKQDVVITYTELSRDLENINAHLKEGWTVIILACMPKLFAKNQKKYYMPINNTFFMNKNLYLCRELVTYYMFFEEYIKYLIKIYNDKINKAELLIPEQFEKIIDKSRPVTYTLTYYIRQWLFNQFSIDQNYIIHVDLSPSYNMRIYCNNNNTMKKVILAFKFFAPQQLNKVRALLKTPVEVKDQYTVSIEPKNTYILLKQCGMPDISLAFYLGQLVQNRLGYANVKIDHLGIKSTIDNNIHLYSLEEFIDNMPIPLEVKLKNIKDHKIDPRKVQYILKPLIDNLKQNHIPNNTVNLNQPTGHFIYKLFTTSWDTNKRTRLDIAKLMKHFDNLDKYITKHDFKKKVDSLITQYYNALTKFSVNILRKVKHGPKRLESNRIVTEYYHQLYDYVYNEVYLNPDPDTNIFKFWFYLQIVLLSYIKGNFFLAHAILNGLRSRHGLELSKIYLSLFSELVQGTFQILIESLNNKDNIEVATARHICNSGICIPYVGTYHGYLEESNKEMKYQDNLILNKIISLLNKVNIENFTEFEESLYLQLKKSKLDQSFHDESEITITEQLYNTNAKIRFAYLDKISISCDIVEKGQKIIKLECNNNRNSYSNLEVLKIFFSIGPRFFDPRPEQKALIPYLIGYYREKDQLDLLECIIRYNMAELNSDITNEVLKKIKKLDTNKKHRLFDLVSLYFEYVTLKRDSVQTSLKSYKLQIEKAVNQSSLLQNVGMFSKESTLQTHNIESPTKKVFQELGLTRLKMPADGSCLYHAVALYLNTSQELLREQVASYIDYNLDRVRAYLELREGQSVESYIQGIRDGNEWAANAEIQALAAFYNRPIVILGQNNHVIDPEVLCGRYLGEPIYIKYNGINHYDVLLQGDNNEAHNDCNKPMAYKG